MFVNTYTVVRTYVHMYTKFATTFSHVSVFLLELFSSHFHQPPGFSLPLHKYNTLSMMFSLKYISLQISSNY